MGSAGTRSPPPTGSSTAFVSLGDSGIGACWYSPFGSPSLLPPIGASTGGAGSHSSEVKQLSESGANGSFLQAGTYVFSVQVTTTGGDTQTANYRLNVS